MKKSSRKPYQLNSLYYEQVREKRKLLWKSSFPKVVLLDIEPGTSAFIAHSANRQASEFPLLILLYYLLHLYLQQSLNKIFKIENISIENGNKRLGRKTVSTNLTRFPSYLATLNAALIPGYIRNLFVETYTYKHFYFHEGTFLLKVRLWSVRQRFAEQNPPRK